MLVLQPNVPSPAALTDPDSASELVAQTTGSSAGSPDSKRAWPGGTSRSCSPSPSCRSPATLLGKFSASPLAIDIFAANLLLATVATQLTVIYGRRQDLVTPETAQQTRAARYRVAASVLVIVVSIVLAWVNPDAAKYCSLLLAVAPRLADRWSGRQAV